MVLTNIAIPQSIQLLHTYAIGDSIVPMLVFCCLGNK